MNSTLYFKDNFLTFAQYARVNLRFTLKTRPITYAVPALLLVAFVFYWASFLRQAITHNIWESGSFYLFFVTVMVFFYPFSTWRGLKKNYTSTRFMDAPVDYQFSADGMDMKSPVMQSQNKWGVFHTFYDFGHYGVLMSSNATGYFLNFAALQAPATKADFLALLRQQNLPVK